MISGIGSSQSMMLQQANNRFDTADKDSSGGLSLEEFKAGAQKNQEASRNIYGTNSNSLMSSDMTQHIMEAFQSADVDVDGALSETEFASATAKPKGPPRGPPPGGGKEVSSTEDDETDLLLQMLQEALDTTETSDYNSLTQLLESITSSSEESSSLFDYSA